MVSVKSPEDVETVTGRINYIRRLANPLGQKPLSWPEFAKLSGRSVGAVKKWQQRGQISHDSAVDLARRMRAAGYTITPEWIRLGEGKPPERIRTLAGRHGSGYASERPPQDVETLQPSGKVDTEGRPKAPLAPADRAYEIAMKVGRAVAHAIQETIEKNELWYPGKGLRDLVSALRHLSAEFTDRGIDTADIDAAIAFLTTKLRAGDDRPGRGGSST